VILMDEPLTNLENALSARARIKARPM